MLLKPDIKLDKITDITLKMLQSKNIDSLLLDVDNTMSTHHSAILTDGLENWLFEMKSSGIKLIILSNSVEKRVKPFAERIGLDYIHTGLKPLPFGFLRGVKRLKSKRKNTAIVGDQIFTDILGGNASGLKTVLLTPIKPETQLRFRIKRKLEKVIYKIYKIEKSEE